MGRKGFQVLQIFFLFYTSDLEKSGASIGPVQLFSNIDNLSLDPVDKNTVMHSQLLQAYKWTNKVYIYLITLDKSLKSDSFHVAF